MNADLRPVVFTERRVLGRFRAGHIMSVDHAGMGPLRMRNFDFKMPPSNVVFGAGELASLPDRIDARTNRRGGPRRAVAR